jgi:hypothetical protein
MEPQARKEPSVDRGHFTLTWVEGSFGIFVSFYQNILSLSSAAALANRQETGRYNERAYKIKGQTAR